MFLTSITLFHSIVAVNGQLSASEVVAKVEDKIRAADQISGKMRIVAPGGKYGEAQFYLENPDHLAIYSSTQKDIFDGERRLLIHPVDKSYYIQRPDAYGTPYLLGFEAHSLPKDAKERANLAVLPTYGTPVLRNTDSGPRVYRPGQIGSRSFETIYNPESLTIEGYDEMVTGGTQSIRFLDLNLAATLPPTIFAPDLGGYKLEKSPAEQSLASDGTTITSFSARDGRNRAVTVPLTSPGKTLVLLVDRPTSRITNLVSEVSEMKLRPNTRVLLVATDSSDSTRKDVNEFANRAGIKGNGYCGANELAQSLGCTKFPAVFIFDADGKLEYSAIGWSSSEIRTSLGE